MPKPNRIRLRLEYEIPCTCGEILHYAPEVLCSLRVRMNHENVARCDFMVLEEWDGAEVCPECGNAQTLELRPYNSEVEAV